jgi:hypothetical protein
MFGSKREEITEDGRRLNNEGPRGGRTGLAGRLAHLGEKRNTYRILVREPDGKVPI